MAGCRPGGWPARIVRQVTGAVTEAAGGAIVTFGTDGRLRPGYCLRHEQGTPFAEGCKPARGITTSPHFNMQESDMKDQVSEMKLDELEQVSGGSLLNRMLDLAMAALGARLIADLHTPLVPPKTMSLHMR